MSNNEDRIEKLLGSITGDYGGDLPPSMSRIEALIYKILASGLGELPLRMLSSGEYDTVTGKPTIENPDPNVFYLVPSRDDTDNLFDEWVCINNSWEKFGPDATKPSRYTFTATIPTTGWEAYQTGLYRVTVPVEGILESDSDGDIGLVQTGTESTDVILRAAYSRITRISAANDAIVVYSVEVPDIAIPIRLEVLR